ncbi:MAG: MBL fold metallo-hydrolase [Rhodospirillaceae bacterium]
MPKTNIPAAVGRAARGLVLALILLAQPWGRADAAGILPAPEKVSDHVYAWIGPLDGPNKKNRGYRMNLSFVVGTQAVLVFDTGYTREMADEMIAHIRNFTPLPIRYAVNSNSQPHRHFGNEAFHAAGAELISTPEEIARMADMGGMFAQFGAQALGLPDGSVKAPLSPVTGLTAARTLDLGGVRVMLRPVGGNHTPNSVIAEIPADKIILAGDVLYSGRLLAILDVSRTGHWLKVFDKLRDYKGYTFVPGHGRPAALWDFEFPTYRYLAETWTHMIRAVKAGVGLDDAVKAFDQSAFAKLANFELLAGVNANWAYQQAEFEAL